MKDIYQDVTDRILSKLESGTVPWHQPWSNAEFGGFPMSMSTGHPYRGINIMLLALTAMEQGYKSRWWGTYDQIAERAGMQRVERKGSKGHFWVSPDGKPRGVRRGEKSTEVILWKRVPRKPREDEDPSKKYTYFLCWGFRVFNAEQADELPAKFYADETAEPDKVIEPIEAAEDILEHYLRNGGPRVEYHGNSAYYRTDGSDVIVLPPRESFDDAESFYDTAFHESGHSTGNEHRLDREGVAVRDGQKTFDHFGSDKYSKEELIAEFTAAMLTAVAGVNAPHVVENEVAYIHGWDQKIRADKKLVVSAAAAAQRAADLIRGIEWTNAEPSNGDVGQG